MEAKVRWALQQEHSVSSASSSFFCTYSAGGATLTYTTLFRSMSEMQKHQNLVFSLTNVSIPTGFKINQDLKLPIRSHWKHQSKSPRSAGPSGICIVS